MCKVIAVANQKGGVAKTTTTLSLGVGLADKGERVCLIDADPQGSLTASLGIEEPDALKISLATLMGAIISEEVFDPFQGIIHSEEGVDLVPGNIELSGLEVSLVATMSRETILRQYIEMIRDRYTYILIDCMPSLGMLTINALACADTILIPLQAAYLPVKGLMQLIRTVGKVKRQINSKLEFEGIVITMLNERTRYAKEIVGVVHENFGDRIRIFDSTVPRSVRAEETSAYGRSIYLHDPRGKVAQAYRRLTEEVLANG